MAGSVQIRDHVLWIKHIHGDAALAEYLRALSGGSRIALTVDGVGGTWEKMADGRQPTLGLKPLGEARNHWHDLQRRRGDWVTIGLAEIAHDAGADVGRDEASGSPPLARAVPRALNPGLRPDMPGPPVAGRFQLPAMVAHADWSLGPAKRFVAEAALIEGAYLIDAPRPVGPVLDYASDLLARAGGGSVLFGVDCPIGVPRAWAKRAGVGNFVELLPLLGEGRWSRFFDVCESVAEIGIERPFYPARPGGSSRKHLLDGLGFEDPLAINRRCDQATANRPRAEALFWTLGGKQVGKAALTFWREMLIAGQGVDLPIRLWPFEGSLDALLAPGVMVVAETYPGEVYHHLDVRFDRVRTAGRYGKRQQADRAANAAAFETWASAAGVRFTDALRAEIEDGFGGSADGEDRFDALVGVCGMVNICLGRRSSGEPADDPGLVVEGWIFGQAATSGRARPPSGASPRSGRKPCRHACGRPRRTRGAG